MPSENCNGCKTKLGFFTTKHVCQSCSQSFCSKCASNKISVKNRSGAIIDANIRLCDDCYKDCSAKVLLKAREDARIAAGLAVNADENDDELKLALALSQKEAVQNSIHTPDSRTSFLNSTSTDKKEDELMRKEEDELQKAIALSLYEVESKTNFAAVKRTEVEASSTKCKNDETAPSLALYLNRDYWEKKCSGNKESASISENSLMNGRNLSSATGNESFVSVADGLAETTRFCQIAKEQAAALDARMSCNLSRKCSIINDNGIRSLASHLTKCHGHLLSLYTKFEANREYYVSLQNNLIFIEEAKHAVAVLRQGYTLGMQEFQKQAQQASQLQMQQQLDIIKSRIRGVGISPTEQEPDIGKQVSNVEDETKADSVPEPEANQENEIAEA